MPTVQARRWPDDMLDGIISCDGKPLCAADVREAMHELESYGYEVVPCRHKCDATGRCTGEPVVQG